VEGAEQAAGEVPGAVAAVADGGGALLPHQLVLHICWRSSCFSVLLLLVPSCAAAGAVFAPADSAVPFSILPLLAQLFQNVPMRPAA